jgi:tetratricopeptide (TPR) repeat protein
MAKRKRLSGKYAGQSHHDQRAEGLIIKRNEVNNASRRSNRLRLVISAGLLLLAAALAYMFLFSPSRAALHWLPNPDLKGMEMQVARKIRALRREVENNPKSSAPWGRLAMNLDVHDLKLESIPCYKQAAALDPAEFRWPYYCAIVLNDMGNAEAFAWFERSRALKPTYAPMHVRHGQALLDAGRLAEASQAFHRALAADSTSVYAYVGLAEIALTQVNLPASQRYLLKALEIEPTLGEAHGLLAEIYRRLNDRQNAEREMLQARSTSARTRLADPEFAYLIAEGVSSFWYRKRGRAYMEKGLNEQAIHEFRLALQAKPDAQAHNDLGAALHALKRYDDAVEQYLAAIVLNPAYPEALHNLGTAFYELGEVERAFAYVKKALQHNPAFPDAYLSLGTFHIRSGRTADAMAAFRQGLAHAPEDIRLAHRLAWLLATASQATLRDGAKAVQLAETVCERTGFRVPETLEVLAAAYAETRQFDRAIATARQAYQVALSARQLDLAGQIQARLQFYEAKQPFREKKL